MDDGRLSTFPCGTNNSGKSKQAFGEKDPPNGTEETSEVHYSTERERELDLERGIVTSDNTLRNRGDQRPSSFVLLSRMQRLIRGETSTLPVKYSISRQAGNTVPDEVLMMEVIYLSNQHRELVARLGAESIFGGQSFSPSLSKNRTHNRYVTFAKAEVIL
eukprot:CAMPEP_0184680998 /NCGR_PEP_ID=MMETSP0312-20130426/3938_1 /TAXON_ID=31354 /ORGANISM="Compsopogon coeruleus, Strain SAG 36.94" /LENGTH=160 /DNA_ID=CAMNT_0027131519 /DNA_START=63 /DNA_END=545 /DNA_ORIENTATION=+